MAVNCIRSKCGHQEIRGRPYFLPYHRPGQPTKDEPHCSDCAKEFIGPQIEANLKDTRTLIQSFKEFFPDQLSSIGTIELVDGKTKIHGRLGGAVVAFRRGDLWPAKAASSTTLAEAHYLIGKHMLEAIARLFPHARFRERNRVTSELRYTRERLVECEAQRKVVDDHRQKQEIIPTDNRRAFLKAANDVFVGAKKVLDVIGGSFHVEERAAHVTPEDGRLIEVVKGFNPTALVTKPEDEVGEAEKLPEIPREAPPETPPPAAAEAESGEDVAGVGETEVSVEPPLVPEIEPSEPAKPKSRKKANGKKADKARRGEKGKNSVRLGSAEADDHITVARAFNNARRRVGHAGRVSNQRRMDAATAEIVEVTEAV